MIASIGTLVANLKAEMFRKCQSLLSHSNVLRSWNSELSIGRKIHRVGTTTSLTAATSQRSLSFILSFNVQKYFMFTNTLKSNMCSSAEERMDFQSGVLKKSENLSPQTDFLDIENVVAILQENLCEDLCVIKLDPIRTKFQYVDYFVVTSGRSLRHLKSMAFLLRAKFKEKVKEMQGKSTAIVEGDDSNGWLAVDIGNIVIHFMMPEQREKYELEKLWTLGASFDDQLQSLMHHNDASKEIPLPFKSKTLI